MCSSRTECLKRSRCCCWCAVCVCVCRVFEKKNEFDHTRFLVKDGALLRARSNSSSSRSRSSCSRQVLPSVRSTARTTARSRSRCLDASSERPQITKKKKRASSESIHQLRSPPPSYGFVTGSTTRGAGRQADRHATQRHSRVSRCKAKHKQNAPSSFPDDGFR